LYSENSIFAEENRFKHGVILYKENYSLTSEYKDLDNDKIFIRNNEIGFPIYKNNVKEIVRLDYYQSIRSNTRRNSAFESIYKFNAGSHYQYDYQDKGNFLWDDEFVRPAKIGLFLLTLFTYSSALQANQRLGDSIFGLNSSSRQETFRKRNSEFIFTAFLTTSFFIGSSVIAYIRFGKDSNWNDLNINNREELSIEQFNYRMNELNSGNKIEFNYVYRF
jgi:hypothetical protein